MSRPFYDKRPKEKECSPQSSLQLVIVSANESIDIKNRFMEFISIFLSISIRSTKNGIIITHALTSQEVYANAPIDVKELQFHLLM